MYSLRYIHGLLCLLHGGLRFGLLRYIHGLLCLLHGGLCFVLLRPSVDYVDDGVALLSDLHPVVDC